MSKFKQYLDEARKNIGSYEDPTPIDILKKYAEEQPWLYATFRKIPRLGINPSLDNPHKETPNGIFAYPLGFYNEHIQDAVSVSQAFSYGAAFQYIFISKIRKGYHEFMCNLTSKVDVAATRKALIRYFQNSPILDMYVQDIEETLNPRIDMRHEDLYSYLKALVEKAYRSPRAGRKWYNVLTEIYHDCLDFDGIIDPGIGALYPLNAGSEDAQSVFFNPNALEIVDVIYNKQYGNKLSDKDIPVKKMNWNKTWTMDHFVNLLMKKMPIDSFDLNFLAASYEDIRNRSMFQDLIHYYYTNIYNYLIAIHSDHKDTAHYIKNYNKLRIVLEDLFKRFPKMFDTGIIPTIIESNLRTIISYSDPIFIKNSNDSFKLFRRLFQDPVLDWGISKVDKSQYTNPWLNNKNSFYKHFEINTENK